MRRTAARVARLEVAHQGRACPGCPLVQRIFVINEGEPRPVPQPCAVCGKRNPGPYRLIILHPRP